MGYLNKPIFKSINARGLPREEGCWSFQLTDASNQIFKRVAAIIASDHVNIGFISIWSLIGWEKRVFLSWSLFIVKLNQMNTLPN